MALREGMLQHGGEIPQDRHREVRLRLARTYFVGEKDAAPDQPKPPTVPPLDSFLARP